MKKRMRAEVKHPEIVKMDIDEVLHSFTERPENLAEFIGARRVAVVADALGENDELTIQYMQLSLQLGVDYLGKKYPYAIKRSTSHVGANAWLKVVYMAIILRNANALQIMCSIPTEILREADTKSPESTYRLVDFMKGLFNSDVDIGELLISAMESLEDIDYMSDIRSPLLSLYRCFLSNEQEEFDHKLDEALIFHKEFWADNPENYHDVDGWVSMELLAVLSLAKDNKKWSLSAQSDYIPSWLVSGELV